MKNTDRNQVVIYGCGANGIHLYYLLKDKMNVLFFVDRNSAKNGYVTAGIHCISYNDFLTYDKSLKVIVSLESPELVVEELKNQGFLNIYTLSDVLNTEQESTEKRNIKEVLEMKRLLEEGLRDEVIFYGDKYSEIKRIIDDYKVRKRNEYCSD